MSFGRTPREGAELYEMMRAIVAAVALILASAPALGLEVPAGPADALGIGEPFAPVLEKKLKNYELEYWDRDGMLSAARAGSLTIQLLGETFALELTEHEVNEPGAVPMIELGDGKAIPDPSYSFESAFFRGVVAGDPDSSALVTITQVGVDGFVRTHDEWIQFEPLVGLVNHAPPMLQVIYRTSDVITKEVDLTGDTAGDVPTQFSEDPFSIMSSHANPSVKLNGDSQFYTGYSSCWYCKMDTVFGRVANIYSAQFSWTLTINGKATCTTSACDSSEKRTSTNPTTLRNDYAAKESQDRLNYGETWTQNALFTGKNLDGGVIGIAFKAGRYSVNQMIDEDDYDGGSIDYEAGILLAHEMGHNFNMTHNDGSYTHWHGAAPFSHYYIETTTWDHEPSEWRETVEEFQSFTRDAMRACNDGTWAALLFGASSSYCS